jgi:hypothetical protein
MELDETGNTLAAWTLIILFSEILKIFKKNKISRNKNLVKETKESLRMFKKILQLPLYYSTTMVEHLVGI